MSDQPCYICHDDPALQPFCSACGCKVPPPVERKEYTFRFTDHTKSYVVRAFKPGDIVLLQMSQRIGQEGYKHLREVLDKIKEETGLQFIIIDSALKVIARLEAETPEILNDIDSMDTSGVTNELSSGSVQRSEEAGNETGSGDRLADSSEKV